MTKISDDQAHKARLECVKNLQEKAAEKYARRERVREPESKQDDVVSMIANLFMLYHPCPTASPHRHPTYFNHPLPLMTA